MNDLNSFSIDDLSIEDFTVIFNEFYPVGQKFNISEDDDPWYIVGYVNDDIKVKKMTTLVIYKSWKKYKQRWCYKIEAVGTFLMLQKMLLAFNKALGSDKICPLEKYIETKK